MNANDFLKEHTCTNAYHRYMGNFLVTDGVLAMATTFSCFWLVDIIASYQGQLKKEPFQVWTLTRTNDTAEVCCTDGNDNVLVTQHIPYTDFKPTTGTIWVERDETTIVGLLPSEH
ncbi:DUF6876 family protein [Nemorincola caseinilytica]|uniref:DUF6876 family protein n=1 Tax=Nemorincola caseinilytica TaxID=2054315 RepID=UPI0031EF403D